MEKIVFKVKGSALEPYEVAFIRRSSDNISALCSCPAGEYGIYCKHRFSILSGSSKGIVSKNLSEIDALLSWLPGTDLESTIGRMRELEKKSDLIKKSLTKAKKDVARAMRD